MATIKEHEGKMTIFYSLATKVPRAYCTGIQDMSYFGDAKDDFNYGVLVTDYDEFVLNNFGMYTVVNDTLVLKNDNYVIKKRNL